MSFNYKSFKKELKETTKFIFNSFENKDTICGFAIFSDEDAGSVGISYERIDHLLKMWIENPEEKLYYKWYFGEWIGDEEKNATLMHNLSKKLFGITFKNDNEFEEHKTKIFEIMVNVLLELKEENTFSSVNQKFVLIFDVSDFDGEHLQKKWISMLNDKLLSEEYLKWIGSY